MCLHENLKVLLLNHGEFLVSLAVIVANLAARDDPRGHTRGRGAGSPGSLGKGAGIALTRLVRCRTRGKSTRGANLDFGKSRGPWRSSGTKPILVAHHGRGSPDSLKRIATRIPSGILRAGLRIGALRVDIGIFTPDAAVGIVLGAASGDVAFGPPFRLHPAKDFTGSMIVIPGAGEIAQILHGEFIHAGTHSIHVGSGVRSILHIDIAQWPHLAGRGSFSHMIHMDWTPPPNHIRCHPRPPRCCILPSLPFGRHA